MELYIVERESSDGLETDIFTDLALAVEWAEHCACEIRTEYSIDRNTLDLMKECTEKVELNDEQED